MTAFMTADDHVTRGLELLAAADGAQPYGHSTALAQRARGHFAAARELRNQHPSVATAAVQPPAATPGTVTIRVSGCPGDVDDALLLLEGRHIHIEHTRQDTAPDGGSVDVAGVFNIADWRRLVTDQAFARAEAERTHRHSSDATTGEYR